MTALIWMESSKWGNYYYNKKGKSKKGVGIEFGSSVTISTIDERQLCSYPNQYGQGI